MSQQNEKGKPQGARIHGQLAAIMAAVDAVGKERRNSGQGFQYRGIEDVMDALHPIFAEHKVFILSTVKSERTEERATMKGGQLIYRVLTVDVAFVSGEDGSREVVTVIGEGMDSGDKAANKAMSAALKYALTQTLILPYGQVDGDQETPPDSKPKASGALSQAAADGRLRSAHDGRVLQPGEDPAPKPKPQASPTADQRKPQASTQRDERTAFHARLYDAMALVGVTAEALNEDLRRKGIMTAAQTIDNLPEKIVTVLLDGTDKTSGRSNWDIVVDRIKKARAA
jgi:hypothetical protein